MIIDCKEAARRAAEAMDRPLTLRERLGMWIHNVICPPCMAFQRQMAVLRQVAGGYTREDRGLELAELPGLPEDARERIRRRLENAPDAAS